MWPTIIELCRSFTMLFVDIIILFGVKVTENLLI
jgi:hypothetical protein